MNTLKKHAQRIYSTAIKRCMPQEAVMRALEQLPPSTGRTVAVAIGKAAYEMAKTAHEVLGERIDSGIVITKYGHAKGEIPAFRIFEAGHPVPDENTLCATKEALALTQGLSERDTVLFLVSGGGSALFEALDLPLEELRSITSQLLGGGASIDEINTVRKHLSNVKGGRFAAHCAPAHVFSVILSDVLGDRLDTIASGPSAADASTVEETAKIVARYGLRLSPKAEELLLRETPKKIDNATYFIGGSVRELSRAAMETAEALGYRATLLTDALDCEAFEAGKMLADLAKKHYDSPTPLAFVAGGETVVRLRGDGLGGRNQETALAAALEIEGMDGVCVFSVGSDGTDGPTDAAGGYADGGTCARMRKGGIDPSLALLRNDSYHALQAAGDLIVTGPTGTNVNDVAVVLIEGKES